MGYTVDSENFWIAAVTTGDFTSSAPDMENKHSNVRFYYIKCDQGEGRKQKVTARGRHAQLRISFYA